MQAPVTARETLTYTNLLEPSNHLRYLMPQFVEDSLESMGPGEHLFRLACTADTPEAPAVREAAAFMLSEMQADV